MIPRSASLAAALAAMLSPAAAQMVTLTPEQVGEVFCLGQTGNDDAVIEAILSPGLLMAIAAAEEENAIIQQAAPDEKPPLGDGIPYAGMPDYPSQCTAALVSESADHIDVAVTYGFSEDPDVHLTDTLVMVRAGDHYRIDNVLYDGGDNLRDVLASVFNF